MKLVINIVRVFIVLLLEGACLTAPVGAQITSSARIVALGGAGSGFSGETGGLFSNPAGITTMTSPGVLFSHRYSHQQPDVSSQAFTGSTPVFNYHIGAFFVQYGLPDAYRESAVGLYSGRKFGPCLRIALGLKTRRLYIPAYVDDQSVAMHLGMQYDLSRGLTLGMVVDDMPLSAHGHRRLARPSPQVTVGVLYHLGEQVRLLGDFRVRPAASFSFQGGLEYMMVPEAIFLRFGMTSHNLLPAAGVGVSRGRFRVDLGSDFHPRLGMSPQFDLNIDL